jgi:predicted HTH transcriptional regulator
MVESRGTGIDKVVNSLEEAYLPALDITTQGTDSTVVTLHEWKKFDNMSNNEKIQAIYWHACLKYRDEGPITNKSIRTRFNVSKNDGKKISNAIASAVEAGYIKQADPDAGRKFATYIPYWADSVKSSIK